jgi:hypothetical protein
MAPTAKTKRFCLITLTNTYAFHLGFTALSSLKCPLPPSSLIKILNPKTKLKMKKGARSICTKVQ